MPKPKKVIPLKDQFIGDLPDSSFSGDVQDKTVEIKSGFYCEEDATGEGERCDFQCTYCNFQQRHGE